ncbi:hypothetical protein HK098_005700 [Nowakowskiella sp. JEL0407]|nr:hypothetical protein HK098_005700 [Nowakowskiella sp. JEL0407]
MKMRCPICHEVPVQPVTLPCGFSVCSSCAVQNVSLYDTYSCRVPSCLQSHQLSPLSVTTKLASCLLASPYSTDYSTLASAYNALKLFHSTSDPTQITNLLEIVSNFPFLQFPYLALATCYAKMKNFNESLKYCKLAHFASEKNSRGMESFLKIWAKVPEPVRKRIGWTDEVSEDEINVVRNALARKEIDVGVSASMESLLECDICLTDFNDPVTSPCGHTFCRSCIIRNFELSSKCPLCRTQLPPQTYFTTLPPTYAINSLLKTPSITPYNPSTQTSPRVERVGIFICTLIYPYQTSKFHIFEPRYRKLIKNALASDKHIAVCVPRPSQRQRDRNTPNIEFGTICRIMDYREIPEYADTSDGLIPRYLVKIEGVYRFKVYAENPEITHDADGLWWANVERIDEVQNCELFSVNPSFSAISSVDTSLDKSVQWEMFIKKVDDWKVGSDQVKVDGIPTRVEVLKALSTIRKYFKRILTGVQLTQLESEFGSTPRLVLDESIPELDSVNDENGGQQQTVSEKVERDILELLLPDCGTVAGISNEELSRFTFWCGELLRVDWTKKYEILEERNSWRRTIIIAEFIRSRNVWSFWYQ